MNTATKRINGLVDSLSERYEDVSYDVATSSVETTLKMGCAPGFLDRRLIAAVVEAHRSNLLVHLLEGRN